MNPLESSVELYHLRPGPDGLTRITARRVGEASRRSWVVPTDEAEDRVLEEWAELHHGVLGFPPAWRAGEDAGT